MTREIFPLTEEKTGELVRKSFMHHAAYPNWKDGDPNSEMSFRFNVPGTTFRVDGTKKHIDRFKKFLEKNGISGDFMLNNFYANRFDIQTPDGNLTAKNRGWLDFYFKDTTSPDFQKDEFVSLGEIVTNINLSLAVGFDTSN